jgi:small subunit ribosomal protein S21
MSLNGMQLGDQSRDQRSGRVGTDVPQYPVDSTSSLGLESAPTCDSLAYSGSVDGSGSGASRAGKGVFEGVAEVKVQEGESVESALRRFKRKVQQEDIIKDIKKHSFYLKPGDKRRAKQALARKRSRKKLRRELE